MKRLPVSPGGSIFTGRIFVGGIFKETLSSVSEHDLPRHADNSLIIQKHYTVSDVFGLKITAIFQGRCCFGLTAKTHETRSDSSAHGTR